MEPALATTAARRCTSTASELPGASADADWLDPERLGLAVEVYLQRLRRHDDDESKVEEVDCAIKPDPSCGSIASLSTTATLEDSDEPSSAPSPSARSSSSGSKHSSDAAGCASEAAWWGNAALPAAHGIQRTTPVSHAIDAQVVKHEAGGPTPRDLEEALRPSADGEVSDPQAAHIATRLRVFDNVSIVFTSRIDDLERIEPCLAEDFMTRRLRFVAVPIRLQAPWPLKTSGSVAAFFGKKNTSFSCTRSDDGKLSRLDLQVNLCSNWLARAALRSVALKLGNVMELVLFDGPSGVPLGSLRLEVTEELLRSLA